MADEEKNEKTEEETEPTEPEAEAPVEADAEETPVAEEAPAPEETPEAEEPAPEPEPVAEAAEEPSGEVPAEEAEEVAEETPAEEPAAEADAPAPEAEAPVAEAEAPPAQSGPKPKRKRLPRSERHKHSKPKRERPAERRPIVRLTKPEHERGRRQERRGVVVSSAMDKTIVVKVDTVKAHPRYKKVVRRSSKFHAHDEQNAAKVGDLVRIVETRPISKSKNWRLAEVLQEAK
jgi:small subunit ribosomal protein S17